MNMFPEELTNQSENKGDEPPKIGIEEKDDSNQIEKNKEENVFLKLPVLRMDASKLAQQITIFLGKKKKKKKRT